MYFTCRRIQLNTLFKVHVFASHFQPFTPLIFIDLTQFYCCGVWSGSWVASFLLADASFSCSPSVFSYISLLAVCQVILFIVWILQGDWYLAKTLVSFKATAKLQADSLDILPKLGWGLARANLFCFLPMVKSLHFELDFILLHGDIFWDLGDFWDTCLSLLIWWESDSKLFFDVSQLVKSLGVPLTCFLLFLKVLPYVCKE